MPDGVRGRRRDLLVRRHVGTRHPGRRSSAEHYLTRTHCAHDETVLWDGVGHFLHQERPTDFARLTRDWLTIL